MSQMRDKSGHKGDTGQGALVGPHPQLGGAAGIAFRNLAEALKPHEAEVPPVWRAFTTGGFYPGECFYRSLRFIDKLYFGLIRKGLKLNDLWLVHGEFQGFLRHAWCELPGDVVFDGIFQQFYGRVGYYDAVFAQPWYKYTAEAASIVEANMPRNPDRTIPVAEWHCLLGLPWADPANPTEIDTTKALELIHSSGLNARQHLCRWGVLNTGDRLTAAGWAERITTRRWASKLIQECVRHGLDVKARAIEALFDAHLEKPLVAELRRKYVTVRLEKQCLNDGAPKYEFVEVDRQPVWG